jgi:hypothetical protein
VLANALFVRLSSITFVNPPRFAAHRELRQALLKRDT